MTHLASVIIALALATCFGRVSAWATAPGAAHACCRGEASAPSHGQAVSDCCTVPAATNAVSVVRVELPPVLISSPILKTLPVAPVAIEGSSSPLQLLSLDAAVPARAPPLA